MNRIPIWHGESKQGADGYWYRNRTQCPFAVRDLSQDECYSGNGQNRCKYFVRYDDGTDIICNHPPKPQQPSLFDYMD